ncbi:MAG: transporter, partial [Sulfurimonas sp.]|nr:transporter [Sulfurimonas sp.]
LADPHLRLSINLLGTPASEFKVLDDSKEDVNTVVGAAISVGVPLGEYFEDKLLNLSSNRWTIRPQLGVVHTRGPWSYELTGSIFFFTDNDSFFKGNELEQNPFYAAQAHIIRVFKPGIWGSLSAGYGKGGASKVNGVDKEDKREGFISALSFGFPLTSDQGLKLSYIWAKTETDTEPRSKTNTFVLGWSIRF